MAEKVDCRDCIYGSKKSGVYYCAHPSIPYRLFIDTREILCYFMRKEYNLIHPLTLSCGPNGLLFEPKLSLMNRLRNFLTRAKPQ